MTVVGNGQTTIHDLPIGDYTVTQLNPWSWRYTEGATANVTLEAGGSTATFADGQDSAKQQWLNGNSNFIHNRRGYP